MPDPFGYVAAAGLSGLSSAFGQHMANQSNKAASMRQMEFQREMSSTAYQRAMADMKKAGLNPILAYKQGGASTPAGSTYQAGNVGLAGAQGAQGYSTAMNLQTQTAIADTTLQMLKRDKLSMAEVQHGLRNIAQPRLFRAIEAGLTGTTSDVPTGWQREIAAKVKEYVKDHQEHPNAQTKDGYHRSFLRNKDGLYEPTLTISGKGLSTLIGMIPRWLTEAGVDAADALQMDIFEMIQEGLRND